MSRRTDPKTSQLLLDTFNHYVGHQHTMAQATHYLAHQTILPIPRRVALDDWRAHVPMHMLECWNALSDDVRIAVYVMAQSATRPYEFTSGVEEPGLN